MPNMIKKKMISKRVTPQTGKKGLRFQYEPVMLKVADRQVLLDMCKEMMPDVDLGEGAANDDSGSDISSDSDLSK